MSVNKFIVFSNYIRHLFNKKNGINQKGFVMILPYGFNIPGE